MEPMQTERPMTTLPTILCCMCGTAIAPNPANMCVACIRGRVDITESIPKQSSIYYCKGCARFLQPPKNWVACELESKELLSICLKKLKGLSKVKLVDAGFKWTEPHSRRIHVRLLIQKEVFNNTILQQEFIVEFIVEYQQCDMCMREAADINQWQAVVQARQKVPHKKTFLYLEQLILKHGAHEDAMGIKVHPDGLDFYFYGRSQALKFVSFLNHVVPIRQKMSDHLVSHDANSNVYRYNYTFSVEIVPLCKDDLVCLPPKVSTAFGGIGPLVLVTRVSQSITLLDPNTLQTAEMSAAQYWKLPFSALMGSKQASQFIVLDIDPTDEANGKYLMADATIARSVDYGVNDYSYFVRTHLGRFLHPEDLALGYDLGNAVYNESLVAGHKKSFELPDFVLIKKTYEKRDRARKRAWRLARLNMELEDPQPVASRRSERGVLDPVAREAADQEEFLQDLEQDKELRAAINLYKKMSISKQDASMADGEDVGVQDGLNSHAGNPQPANGDGMAAQAPSEATVDAEDESEEEADEYPQVPVEELLDGLVLEDPEQEP